MGQESMSLPEAPGTCHNVTPRRQRRFATKVRTGCITCRIRRIKCDEAKPYCHRCTSTGRKCDGYAILGPATRKPQSPPAQPTPGGNPEERQALYIFRTKVAMSIASSLDFGFWAHDLLQTAETYRTVQHAVVALATAYRSSILIEHGSRTQERQFILTQYNKSITSLQHCLSNQELLTRDQKVIILMVNLVFICICAVQGFQEEACVHLRNGLSLFHEWQLGVSEGSTQASTPTPVKLLATLYTQLDTQARMIMESSYPHKMRLWPPHSVVLDGWGSGHLATITKATSQLERLHNASIQLTTPPGPPEHENTCLHQHMPLYHHLQTWDLDFGPLLSQGGTAIKYLQIRRLLTGANFELWRSNTSKAPGPSPTWASKILELVNEIMQDSRFLEARVVFTPAGGLVEALYFVATRCHDTRVKRVAIEILERRPILEGLWNSSMAYAALHNHHATW
ncbi:hypothetical protein MRS44_011434 [Fusarium solani]|uniref:uncharacterized protein n=1 Tax=Fusarium solani TaxID=169388 RepID=UPI0032C48160|nr:hypothetical protein MRS44_011434 [Fusarium solani]